MKTISYLSQDCEIQILLFLWQWKLATSATLGFRFFNGQSSRLIYRKLNSLERYGYIETRKTEHIKHSVWVLTQKGFCAIQHILPELKENGYKSESINHDFLVNALHLGDWLNDRPKNVEVFTEQQLRRFDFEFYPQWVPKTIVHRPDGYLYFKNPEAPLTVALEVELNIKCKSRYDGLGGFYAATPDIDRVIWVAPILRSLATLQNQLKENEFKERRIHNFILLNDLVQKGWHSEIKLGPEQGQTLKTFFVKLAGGSLMKNPESETKVPPHHFLCDTRKWGFTTAI